MARSTRKSLAGAAAGAARKVIRQRGSTDPEPQPAEKTTPAKKTAKGTTAKGAASVKSTKKSDPASKGVEPAVEASTKEAASKKTAVKKTAAKKAPAKKAPAKKAPAKKAPAKKAPAKKAPAKKTTAKTAGSGAASTEAAAHQAPLSSLVVKEGEEAWSPEELTEVLDELHEQRRHSVEIIEGLDSELTGLMRDAGDGAGQDQADIGSTTFERDHELTVLSIERDKLAQIDRALARIDDGTYGVCESCEQPIGKMRLMVFPRATLCMTCKQREERR